MHFRALPVVALASLALLQCSKKHKATAEHGAPPPPIESSKPGACASGGGKVSDPVSAAFFPRRAGGYCIDPNGRASAYGQDAKGTLDQVCTQLFDGECEVYKSYGLKRVVTLRYIDGKGSPGAVNVNLSRFATKEGAYGFFTKRVVADSDPLTNAPRALSAGGDGALGSGIAYVWRGDYVAELSYTNDVQPPDALKKSADAVLPPIAKGLGQKLPGDTAPPAAVQALPVAHRIAMGVRYDFKNVLKIAGAGPGAEGFYKNGEQRWREFAIVRRDEDSAKDVMKTLRKLPGAKWYKKLPFDAVGFSLSSGESGPKLHWIAGRAGGRIFGVGDEEYAFSAGQSPDAAARVSLSHDKKLGMVTQLVTASLKRALAPSPTKNKSNK